MDALFFPSTDEIESTVRASEIASTKTHVDAAVVSLDLDLHELIAGSEVCAKIDRLASTRSLA